MTRALVEAVKNTKNAAEQMNDANPIFLSLFSEKWLVGQMQRNPNLHDRRE